MSDPNSRKASVRDIPPDEPLLPNDRPSRLDLRLVALFLAGFSTFIDMYATQPVLPILRHSFGGDAASVSTTVSATTFAVAISAPFMGLIGERIGRKQLITGSILLLTLPTLLAATSQNLTQLVFWRFLQGLCLPGIITSAMAYVSEEWGQGKAGRPMSAYISGTVLGGFGGRFIVGLVANQAGWREGFLVLGVINLIGGLVVWRFLPRSRSFHRELGRGEGLRSVISHLHNPALLSTYFIGFAVLFCLVAMFNYMSFLLHGSPYHFSPGQIGSVFLVYLVGVVVTPMSGRLIDRFGGRAMTIAGLLCSMLGAVITLASPVALILVGLTLCSSGIFVCQTSASNRVGQVATGARSTAAGFYVSFYYLGGSVGATLGGRLWLAGGWFAVVGMVVLVEAIGAAFVFALWKPRPIIQA